jgi:hypothetical protein
MSLYVELWRQYGHECRKDQLREAAQWRLGSLCARPSWLARQGFRLLCRLGARLVRVGRHLQQVAPDGQESVAPSEALLNGSSS